MPLAHDLPHIRAVRDAPLSPMQSAQHYNIQPIGLNPMRQLNPHRFIDFYTEARRELATLRAPVVLGPGLAFRSQGDRLAQSVNDYAANRVGYNQRRVGRGQQALPDLSVGLALAPFAAVAMSGPQRHTPGVGSGSLIGFDPGHLLPSPDTPHQPFVPPSIVLGHELIHARAAQQGRTAHNFWHEAFQTVGLSGSRRFTENQLRAERGMTPRTSYAGFTP
ncbi:type III secretion system effector protein [Chitiniphilus purpureus]|uniref:Type III secretion system effector protein n=1 Tax=Chitiniphilus purpureus TaxID=2981137 RepID=A0ABY6DMP6_9NEIS|nr:type III secretion system effector protein [Chitiniphilus sp. CD1]UXY15627.1 type III secretion system effector protein [Chitiniphilus sp. CD1]